MVSVPFCYFFDIDGTIIGDITSQVYEWDVVATFEPAKMAALRKNVCAQLAAGLLRPGLATLMDFLKARHASDGGCEFFIYTASDPKWAAFIVRCVEAVVGHRFKRPIFARQHCVKREQGFVKSFIRVLPAAIKRLGVGPGRQSEFRGRFVLIDNNRVLPRDQETRLILCPTYMYTDTTDVLRLLSESVLQARVGEIADFLQARSLLYQVDDIAPGANQVQVLKARYYTGLNRKSKETVRDEGLWIGGGRDAYWTRLGNVMQGVAHTTLKDGAVAAINAGLAARGGV